MSRNVPSKKWIAALAGRLVDSPGADPRFPVANIPGVRRELERRISEHVATLVTSAACGADLLALETADRLGVPYHIVLPFAPEKFRKTSVMNRPGADWDAIFNRVVGKAAAVDKLLVCNLNPDSEVSFRVVNHRILALARAIQADAAESTADRCLVALLVWEGKSRGSDDVTDEFRRSAQEAGFQIDTVLTLGPNHRVGVPRRTPDSRSTG